MSTQTPTPAAMMDDAWVAASPRRSRFRSLLIVLLVAGLVFLAGIEVQKRYGAADAGGAARAGGGGAPAGLGAAGAAGPGAGGGFPGGSTNGAATAPSASASSAGAAASSAVIGTVTKIKGNVWTVTDLGGTAHRVSVGSGAAIVKESAVTAQDVATGATVDVTGSTDDQGRVTAATITVR